MTCEQKNERLIRRLRHLVFDPDDVVADKAHRLLGKALDRRAKHWPRKGPDPVPSWLTRSELNGSWV